MNKIVMGLRAKGFEYAPHLLYTSFFEEGGNFVFLDMQIEFMQISIIAFNFNSHAFKARDPYRCKKNIISRKQRSFLTRVTTKHTPQRENSIEVKIIIIIIIILRSVNFKIATGRN